MREGSYKFSRQAGQFLLAAIPFLLAAFSADKLAAQTSSGSTLTVLPLGDSITYGLNVAGGYESTLQAELASQGTTVNYTGVATVNGSTLQADGFSGYMISDVTANLTGSYTPPSFYTTTSNNGGYWLNGGAGKPVDTDPNIVLLMLGTNDITIGYDPTLSPNSPYAVTEDTAPFDADMTSRLETLVATVRSDLPNALILVASPPPETVGNAVWNARFAAFGPDIQTMISTDFSGQNVDYVDMYGAFETAAANPLTPLDTFIAGNQHPDAAGYALMAQTWDNAITQDYLDADPAAVPEPSTYALLIGGALGLYGWRKLGKARR